MYGFVVLVVQWKYYFKIIFSSHGKVWSYTWIKAC